MFKIFVIALGLYVSVVVLMYVFQRHLLYLPGRPSEGPARSGVPEMHIVELNTADGLTLKAWYKSAERPTLPTLIYFHGNAGNLAARVPSIQPYLEAGLGVLLVGYRGYDGNPGTPTEEGLYNDGRAALQWVERQQHINPLQVILVGESLGSGVATQMAIEFPIGALVLQSSFTSIADVAQKHYRWVPIFHGLIKDPFDNLSKIHLVTAPLLVLHGTADSLVPISLAKRLYRVAGLPKQSKWYEGIGHNALMSQTPPDVMNFLKEQNRLSP